MSRFEHGPRAAPSADISDHLREAQKFVDRAKRDAARRSSGARHLSSQTADVMRKLLATPLMSRDLHCHNLFVRISRAGNPDEFADRVMDLHFHISRLTSAAGGSADELSQVSGHGSSNGAADSGRVEADLRGNYETGDSKGRHRIRL